MKKFLSYLSIVVLLISCSAELDPTHPEYGSGITVRVSGGDPETKMTSELLGEDPGVEEFNENLIKSLDIFFFRSQDMHETDADYAEVPANHHIFVSAINKQTTCTVAQDIDLTTIKKIFGKETPAAGDNCEVYVIANLDEGSSRFADNSTHRTLRSAVLDAADFSKVTSETVGGKVKKTGNLPESFVMEGWDAVTLVKESGIFMVQADIALYRAAAKVKLEVTIPQDVTDNGVTDGNGFEWVPLVDAMEVIMMDGVNRGVVCAVDTRYTYDIQASDYYPNPPTGTEEFKRNWNWENYGHTMESTGTKTKMESGVEVNVGPKFEHAHPFYSYPTKNWKNAAENEAYMVLMLPWQRKGKTEFHNTYYQIPIVQDWAFDEYRLKSNRYYRMEVAVSILGSFSAQDLTTIVPNSFIVLSWRDDEASDPTEADVNMSHTSYLAVAANAVEMYNINSASVDYASSHNVTVQVTQIEFMDYSQKQIRMGRVTPSQPNRIYWYTQNASGDWVAVTGTGAYTQSNGIYASYVADITTKDGAVTLTHNIPSDMYTVQTITVKVSNGVVDDETIVFTQYPPISLEAHQSNGYVFVNRVSNESDVTNIYTAGNADWIGSLTARSTAASVTGTGSNTNPNIYSIHISSFSDDEFVIGDPRVSTPDNNMGHTNASWSSGVDYLTEPPSSGSYSTVTVTEYYTYSEYVNGSGEREYSSQTSRYNGTPNYGWGSYTSESSAYGPDANNYYYWRTSRTGGYTYHRARYYANFTRYQVTSQLENYRPTATVGTENMIAPEILIASSYGKTSYSNMTLERAALRCALYQEDGYPAGRWRLPTFAEVKFIMSLSTQEQIPSLFNMSTPNDNEGYWCANGRVILKNNVVELLTPPGSTPTAPRCVYDLWYWGDKEESDPYATTWHLGDND